MTDRTPLAQLTKAALDQLYDDLDRYEELQGEMNENAIDLTRRAARAEAAIARVRGYVEHALAVDGPGIGLSPGHILALLDCDPMRTTTQAAGQPEPATITDPEWLKQQYTAALHDADEHSCQEQDGVDYPRLAAAVIRVRDRHLQQLRQRLQLADATLREILTGGQITGDRITRWRATLDELQEQPRV
jgi:hypothetical protein